MISYKNITDVEVLEQASENTKVLVNEGGELMQAPYSNFEDKIRDAEVLEEVPENAKVLVNDNGKLKQAACSGFCDSGIVTIHCDDNENYSSTTAFTEFNTMIQDSTLQTITLFWQHSSDSFSVYYLNNMYANSTSNYIITFFNKNGEIQIRWDSTDGISRYYPPV
jgi:hypothetical protein